MKHIAFVIICFFVIFCPRSYANEALMIVYIHGLNVIDQKEVNTDASAVAYAFREKTLGKYRFSGTFIPIYWNDLFKNDNAYKMYKSGLLSANTDHNKSRLKAKVANERALLNPFRNFVDFKDRGSGAVSVFYRNAINDSIYQIIAFQTNKEKQNLLFNKINSELTKTDKNFVIIAHSFGTPLAVEYISKSIANNPVLSQRFVGLISSGDLSANLLSMAWQNELEKTGEIQFPKYITEKNKFWINLNHRNDIFGTNIPCAIRNYKAYGKGFISSETTVSNSYTVFGDLIKLFSLDNSKISAHNWMLLEPEIFSKKIVNIYYKHYR